MRLIDADAFRRELDNHWPFTKEEQSKHGIADMAKSTLLVVLNYMPTIDDVPVVRCKDCKFFVSDMEWCEADEDPASPDAFCSWAERRSDE